jgi:dCTP deaminase
MAILTGQEIKNQINNKHIRIGNFDDKRVQPNSYDVTLGNKVSFYSLTQHKLNIKNFTKKAFFRLFGFGVRYKDSRIKYVPYLDTKQENDMIVENIPDTGYLLLPNNLYIVETVESFWSDKFVSEVSGTSSLARLGITVHKTAGYANLGHEFKWILEVEVTHPVMVYSGMKIGQVYFHTTIGETNLQYEGKYKDEQMGNKLCGSLNHIE